MYMYMYVHAHTVHITRDNVDDAVGHSQRLVELLCIVNHLIHQLPGDVIMRAADAKLLNLQCIHVREYNMYAQRRKYYHLR